MQLINRKWSEEQFLGERRQVLAAWPTGREVYLDEAVAYQKAIPMDKRFQSKLDMAIRKDITLIQPRAGVPLIAEHIRLLRHLETEGGADLLPTTIDAYTRLNRYEDAQHGIEESEASGKAILAQIRRSVSSTTPVSTPPPVRIIPYPAVRIV